MEWKRFLSIPVCSVFLLMGFVYYITVFIFIEDWVGLQSSAGTLNAMIFTFMASLCLFSFLVCVLTEPGYVPSPYVPDVEGAAVPQHQEPLNNSSQLRRCDKCVTYKPPRAHHCRVCRRCVLRMDHHCLWINNCVGYWNYKAFFILVLYATIASIYSSVMIISCASQKNWNFSGRIPMKIFFVFSGAMMFGLSITFGTLLGWHIYLMSCNLTTIENYEGIRAAWLARKSGHSYRHPFNLSVYKNITSVLGPNILKWLCPTAVSHLKDGMSYPTAHDS
ncbi:PREDICTED: probable protein S-acyltransferase 15 isoform X1 [Populus euphratica]|uniref:S-acyltransferase n=1 Tax=Populus euphratica TaxID=75702 RepID=A0AAJ6Y3E0_POPEU|nr:PREDICTED: probable protein S-acyltransferase 15 isoform X1 [Populus euphratica]XP_011041052.1 PREDICTED: probable protein S-acyltransferase 15 isoform X1 [Populus euphratica]XP_011041053.1 PREDICTED: probable protein S-acyltransferase 15 isoform X1 [Populus euphratica]